MDHLPKEIRVSLTVERPRVTSDDRVSFRSEPPLEMVALLAAVSPLHDGLKVYVCSQTAPAEDFLDGDPQPVPTYRVFAGTGNLLSEVSVTTTNSERDPAVDDIHIVTNYGDVYLPQHDCRLSPYYNYTKMYDVSDVFRVTRFGSNVMTVRPR